MSPFYSFFSILTFVFFFGSFHVHVSAIIVVFNALPAAFSLLKTTRLSGLFGAGAAGAAARLNE